MTKLHLFHPIHQAGAALDLPVETIDRFENLLLGELRVRLCQQKASNPCNQNFVTLGLIIFSMCIGQVITQRRAELIVELTKEGEGLVAF